jgi:hypothetical protein
MWADECKARATRRHHFSVSVPHPRGCLGRVFEHLQEEGGVPAGRLQAFLGLAPPVVIELALAPLPDLESAEFCTRIAALAARYGVAPWRLEYLCRLAGRYAR